MRRAHSYCSDTSASAALRSPYSYWAFVATKTFKENILYLQQQATLRPTLDRERAWICLALNEGTLQSYFLQFAQDRKHIKYGEQCQ